METKEINKQKYKKDMLVDLHFCCPEIRKDNYDSCKSELSVGLQAFVMF